MRKVILILVWFAVFIPPILGQSIKTIENTYIYYASPNETIEGAKRRAIARAKTEALRENFGTVISGASATSMITRNNLTDSKFVHLASEGELRGEWIADIEEPVVTTTLEGEFLVVKATVRGKAREISNNTINFKAKILRNKPEVELESSEFTAGNSIFVHFTSPVDGFLSIYLLDGENAYCLLPYSNSKSGVQPIIHNHEYTFFSRKIYAPGENPDEIDEYTLTTEGEHQDINQIYFIFSPHKFTKALDEFKHSPSGTLYPRTLSWRDFQKWILRARRDDMDMCVQTKYIVISPKR